MHFGKKVETAILVVIGVLCIVIPVLSFLGMLDSVQWISTKKVNFILLSVGLLLTYLVSGLKKAEEDRKNNMKTILGAIKLDEMSERFRNLLQDLWSKREKDIDAIFEKVKNSMVDQDSLPKILEQIFNDMVSGQYFGTIMALPWDITIGALGYHGAFIYHPSIPARVRIDDESPHQNVLKERNGTITWENDLASEQLNALFPSRAPGNKRFTKIYFRDFPEAKAVVYVESHINIIDKLPPIGVTKKPNEAINSDA